MVKHTAAESFTWQTRVYYEDTDMSGLVYHANYVKFFERARTEWLRNLGHDQAELKERDKLVFAVRRLEIDYMRAAKLDDLVDISVVVTPSRHHVFCMIAQEAKVGQAVIARANVKLACLDAETLAARTMPDFLRLQAA